ncbi:TlpA disulfide reductase family protein [Lacihabitans sp. CS3-21]|uniref:TlpA family protein disulfide reductase n=1 Tax=Lacihabitans sp. CS3-21 TaxID=2487332 RepID=UPI0020CF2279|nr:TlpA disulfide reductase family protein [Lacihabitans sp. CS3-21]MCP9747208.1 TlpA family protein disulfide reductase [Lacihabitans sp. CS3-21]
MKLFLTLLFFLIIIGRSAFGSQILIKFEGQVKASSELSVFYSKNLEEKIVVFSQKVVGKEDISFELDNSHVKFYYFQIGKSAILLKVKEKDKITLTYDGQNNKWNLKKENDDYFEKTKVFIGYMSPKWKDSSSFVRYHIDFMDSLGLDPFNKRKIYTSDQSFLRRTFFNLYVDRVSGYKLFKFPDTEQSAETNYVEEWANLSQIDYRQSSYYELETIRRYIIFHLPVIYKNLKVPKPNFAELLVAGETWINSLEIDENLKIYILGDLIRYMAKFNLPLDVTTQNFLENFCIANPNSAHLNFVQSFLKQKQSLSMQKFEIDAVNLHNEKFEVKKYNDKIILIDFWATWCGPCIAANPFLEKIKAKYQGKVKVIKISIDDNWVHWERFVRDKDGNIDDNYIVTKESFESEKKKFNLVSVPRYWIVNSEGKVLNMEAPSPMKSELEEYLIKVLE